jgi:hypothetical protein
MTDADDTVSNIAGVDSDILMHEGKKNNSI